MGVAVARCFAATTRLLQGSLRCPSPKPPPMPPRVLDAAPVAEQGPRQQHLDLGQTHPFPATNLGITRLLDPHGHKQPPLAPRHPPQRAARAGKRHHRLMFLSFLHGFLPSHRKPGRNGGWAAGANRQARRTRWEAPEGPERSGGPGAAGLQPAATSVEESDAHPSFCAGGSAIARSAMPERRTPSGPRASDRHGKADETPKAARCSAAE